jgi:hypothetical protein
MQCNTDRPFALPKGEGTSLRTRPRLRSKWCDNRSLIFVAYDGADHKRLKEVRSSLLPAQSDPVSCRGDRRACRFIRPIGTRSRRSGSCWRPDVRDPFGRPLRRVARWRDVALRQAALGGRFPFLYGATGTQSARQPASVVSSRSRPCVSSTSSAETVGVAAADLPVAALAIRCLRRDQRVLWGTDPVEYLHRPQSQSRNPFGQRLFILDIGLNLALGGI